MAHGFAQEGARLLLSARRADRLAAVQRRCEELGARYVAVLPLDLENTASLEERSRVAEETLGPIDLLVNNAGIAQSSEALETSLEVTERILRINFLGTVAITRAIAPRMVARKRGDIAVVSSLLGKFAVRRRSSYAASKHALHGYFDALRLELDGTGIGVSLICPGWVATDIDVDALRGDGTRRGRLGSSKDGMTPERFAGLALEALRTREPEAYLGGPEVRGVWAKRFVPSLLHRVLARTPIE
jgi:dehydrogenase/reductase SDR family protein 7B